ncbi:MAG: hypothetical protein OXE43_13135 [Chloroflexi bacterium]|nr:hypothetical protein [Chloroflexota bacterium]
MRRELIDGFENRFLFLAAATFSLVLMFIGLVTPAIHGTEGAGLLVQEGATVAGSGSWACLYLLTAAGALIAWLWWSIETPLWARAALTVPGGVVLLIAAMQGAAVSDLIDSLGREDLGLGPGYWLLGAGGALLFLSSALACLADYAPDFSITVTRRKPRDE